MAMADRIAILDKGEVMQVATPPEIYEAPGSRFVADFVGSVNLFEGQVTRRYADQAEIEATGMMIQTANPGEAEPGRTVHYAIRPEKIRVSSFPPDNVSANAAQGEIYDIAYLGDVTVYNVKLDSGMIVKSTVINSQRLADDPLTWGDRAWIAFKPDAGVVLTR